MACLTGIACKVCSMSTILCAVGKSQIVRCWNATEIQFREFNQNFHYVSDQFALGLGVLTFSGFLLEGFSVCVSSGFAAVVVVSLVPELGKIGRFVTNAGSGKLLMIPIITLPIPAPLLPSGLLSSVSPRVT